MCEEFNEFHGKYSIPRQEQVFYLWLKKALVYGKKVPYVIHISSLTAIHE